MNVVQEGSGVDGAHLERELASLAGRLSKRSLDLTVATLSLLVLLPLLALIALAVKLHDGGPVLFRQARIGKGGQPFRIAKFRTMVVDAESRLRENPELYARYLGNGCKLDLAEDVRVSRLGRFLRASSLDELPQLLNVLRGDMSLVGPRPIVEVELREYAERGAASAYLSTRPGVTGLWQVSGRNRLGYDDRVKLDVVYLSSASLGHDVRILFRTPLAVLRRDGVH
jgi:lipopolysaccharide/colanic/teichoic acid biosynthesis glycosyltransferase